MAKRRPRKKQAVKTTTRRPAGADEPIGPEPPLHVDLGNDASRISRLNETAEDPIAQMRAELEPGGILAVVSCGDERRDEVYSNYSVAKAAEKVATKLVQEFVAEGSWPHEPILVTCYTREAQFGPFPVDIDVTVDARFLRGSNGQP